MESNKLGSRAYTTPTQSVIALSALILFLLTSRAIFVAMTSGATTTGIGTLIIYSVSLIIVGFIAGVNVSNIKSAKHQENSFLSNSEEYQTTDDFIPNLGGYNSTERFIIEFLIEHDLECWQSDFVNNSEMTNSKVSRSLSKLESQGIITRVREGMSKRVNLNKNKLM